MKITIYKPLVFFGALIFFASCKPNPLVGKWSLLGYGLADTILINKPDSQMIRSMTAVNSQGVTVYSESITGVFRKDGTYNFYDNEVNPTAIIENGKYVILGNDKMILNNSPDTVSYSILKDTIEIKFRVIPLGNRDEYTSTLKLIRLH